MVSIDRLPVMGHGHGRLFQWAAALVKRHGRYTSLDLEQVQRHLHGIDDSIALSIDRPEDFIG